MHQLSDYYFQPVTSKIAGYVTAMIHGLAMIATLANTLTWGIKAILLSVIITHLIVYLHHDKHSNNSTHIYFSEAEGWRMRFNESQVYPVQLLGSSLSTCWIIILRFKIADTSVHSLLICRDSLSIKHYQHLQLMLKLHFR